MGGNNCNGNSGKNEPSGGSEPQHDLAVQGDLASDHLNLGEQCSFGSVEKSGAVLFVTLNLPQTRNAFGLSQARALLSLLEGIFRSNGCYGGERVGALVLRSALDGVFASGGDVHEIREQPARAAQSMDLMRASCLLLSTLPVFSVALLSGAAIGGGAELSLACDERWVLSGSARLELRQRAWGLPFGWNGLRRLVALRPQGGVRRAALDFAEGRTWTADELLAQRLADADARAWSTGQVAEALDVRARRLLQCPPDLARALLHDTVTLSGESADFDAELFRRFWKGPVHEQALARLAVRTESVQGGPV
jgi:methylglutaconyl-CoA hydratase